MTRNLARDLDFSINGGSQTYIDVAIIDMGEHLVGFDRIK